MSISKFQGIFYFHRNYILQHLTLCTPRGIVFISYYSAELVRAEKELSDWFLSGLNFPIRTAKMDRSGKDLTKSNFGNILEESTALYEVETLAYNFEKNLYENNIIKIVCSRLSSL